jgi:hypothetical protein
MATRKQLEKVAHTLPISFERPVREVYDQSTGKLLRYEVTVELICDGRIDVKPGELLKVTLERRTNKR